MFGDMKCAELGLHSVPLFWASMHELLVSFELQFPCFQASSKDICPGCPIFKGDAGWEGPSGKQRAKQRLRLPVRSPACIPIVLKAGHPNSS